MMKDKEKIILMYSYKGGSGRTVITANLAFRLAELGKNVLCIDADVHGPGLRLLFDIEQEENCFFQDYVLESDGFSLDKAVKNMNTEPRYQNLQGTLHVLPASQDYNKQLQKFNFREITRYLERLLKEVKEANISNPDIVLLDSTSGYNEISKAGFSLANYVIVFYRYSKQHLLGTKTMEKFLKQIKTPFSLVASAVPDSLAKVNREGYERYLIGDLDLSMETIVARLPEEEKLKWDECILYCDDLFTKTYKPDKGKYNILEELNKIATLIVNL
jgi:MinD-like ATPase involved in chromosome partitioning or flagellar assembly